MALNFLALTLDQQVSAIFVGYYNRAPAVNGLNVFKADFADGQSPADVARSFVPQTETTNLYPSITSESLSEADAIKLVTDVFNNLFNKPPSKPGADNFFVKQLLAGEKEVGQVILDIMSGAKDDDLTILLNKINVGVSFVEAAVAAGEDGKGPLKDTILDGIDATQASVDAANAEISAAFPVSGTSIILTTSQDQPGGGGGGIDTQGTANNDAYSATYSANGGGTLQNEDVIAAAGGTADTLTVRVISLSGAETVAPEASGLEEVIVNNQASSGRFILNFAAISGETSVTAAQSSGANTAFTNLDSGTDIRVVDNDGVVLAHFKGDRSASTTDAFDLYIENSGTETTSTKFITTDETTNTRDQTFEIANIETGGTAASFLDLEGLTLETLVVTGDQRLFVEDTIDGFETLGSVDASGMTGGGVFVNAEGSTVSSFSFIGSGEADFLQLDNDLFNNPNTLSLNGGDGMDTLIVERFNNLSPSSINQVTSFEMLQASESVTSLVASDYTNIDTFVFAGQTTNQSRLNITGVENDDNFIFTSDQGRGDETVRFFGENPGTSLTFELQAQSGAGGEVRIVTDINSGSPAAIGFGNTNITSVEIISSGSNIEANVIRSEDAGSNLYYAFDNQNGPTNFTISGSQALTITAEAGVNLNAASDERGFEGAVNLDASNATGDLRLAGSGFADVIQGGSGNDILYGLGGDNVLTGNAGMDQFRFSTWNDTSTIQDFTTGEDKVGLQRVDFANTTATQVGAIVSADDYIENVSSITGMSASESDRIVELQTALSGDQIANQTSSATDAYVLVFNSTSGKGELWFDTDWSTAGGSRSQTAEFDNIDTLAELIGLSNTDFVEYSF